MPVEKAFTLIELLIVVAIIAILAAIAVPNFLEAQTRAKVSRAKSDLRTVATALESYAVDNNTYPPNDGLLNVLPVELTTPIAYMTNASFRDPFAKQVIQSITLSGADTPFYTYTRIVSFEQAQHFAGIGRPCPNEAIDHWSKNLGAFDKYGQWRMVSVGPDRKYLDATMPPVLRGSDIPYDPSNGTVSFGNILRTQKYPEWEQSARF